MSTAVIGAYESKTQLPRVLRDVQAGQSFDIAVRGVKVARLVLAQAQQFISLLQACRWLRWICNWHPPPPLLACRR